MKAEAALGFLSGTVALLATVQDTGDVIIPTNQLVSDLWRVFVMTNAGISLGFLAKIIYKFSRLNFDPNDKFLKLVGGVSIGYFLMTLYVGMDLASRLGDHGITWRTPLGMITFVLSNVFLYRLKRRLRVVLAEAESTKAVVKATLTNTRGEGPDIDLSNGNIVTTTRPEQV